MAEKFMPEAVSAKLTEYGCQKAGIRRAIVTWDCKDGVVEAAKELGIEVWLLPDLMDKIAALGKTSKAYLSDDTLRTLTLFRIAMDKKKEGRHGSKSHDVGPVAQRGLGRSGAGRPVLALSST